MALVCGEPGIGKTRLISELAATVSADGGTVWWGAAFEGDVRAYAPVAQMVEEYARAADPEVLRERLGVAAALVARAIPELRPVLGPTAPAPVVPAELERERTEDALVGLAVTAAGSSPLLVVLDDAHWADAQTLDLIRRLARRASRLPMLVVIAYRDTDLDRMHPLASVLPGLRREPHVERLTLRGLDASAVRELVEDVARHAPPDDFTAALLRETGGNPFFVREVALYLLEEGRVRPADGEWAADPIEDLAIPEGVREVIGRRLTRLSGDANRLLAVAAAFEAGFDLTDVAGVVGLDEAVALDAIEEALGAGIVVPDRGGVDQYRFSHALFRHTLWSEGSPSRQVRLHRAIAEHLAGHTSPAGAPRSPLMIARHYHLSTAIAGGEAGVPFALAAADDAARRVASAEEYQALAIALDLIPAGDGRVGGLSERAARTAVLAGRPGHALTHARQAVDGYLEAGKAEAAVAFVVALGRLAEIVEMHSAWPFAHLVDACRASLDERTSESVQLLAWEVVETEFLDPENPGIAVDSPARRRMHALAAELDPSERPLAYLYPTADSFWRAAGSWVGSMAAGRYREARDALRRSIEPHLAAGVIGPALFLMRNLGRAHVVLGELDEASEVQARGEALLARVDPASNNAAQFAALSLFQHLLTGADPALPLAIFDFWISISHRPDLRWVSGPIRLGRAPLLAALGRRDEARSVLADNLAVVTRAAVGAPNLPMAVHWAAQAAWIADAPEFGSTLEHNVRTKVLEPGFHYFESDGHWDMAVLAALADRPGDARPWFRSARERLRSQGAITLLPHVACDEALMEVRLGAQGDRANAHERLDEAHHLIGRIGLAELQPRVDDLRRRLTEG